MQAVYARREIVVVLRHSGRMSRMQDKRRHMAKVTFAHGLGWR